MSELKKPSKEQFIQLFRDAFVCREDVFAEGFPRGDDKYSYYTSRNSKDEDNPLTDDVIWSHLKGDRIIGIYPLIQGDRSSWLALDFDEGEDPIGDAFRQQQALTLKGLTSYVERSRSGNGAHLWMFFEEPIKAFKSRRVMFSLLLPEFQERYLNRKNTTTAFVSLFPNQDSAGDKYGNLIALPYHGESYKSKGNSCFIDKNKQPLHPLEFFEKLRKNKVEVIDLLFSKLPSVEQTSISSGVRKLPVMKLPGGLKVCEFCNWVKQAKERMPKQNQEPELYSLACQFAQLEGGNRLIHEIGAMHPYSEARIEEKWNRAVEQNKPETCNTLRAKYGDCGKRCDQDLKITHPYELASISFSKLQAGERPQPESYSEIAPRILAKAERILRKEEEVGIAYGWDDLDDLTELREGNLIIVAALPSIGKTASMIDLVVNLGSRNIPSYLCSLEMLNDEIGQRVVARRTGIDATALAKGQLSTQEWKALAEVVKDPLPFYVDDKASTLEQILDVFGDMVHKHGKGVGIVDYMQIVAKEPGEDDRQAVGRVVVGLKAIAKFLKIPVIGLSQLGRGAEKDERDGLEPLDAWLASSSMIERVADVIIYVRGKRGQGVVPRRFRIHKERHRGVAGIELNMDFDQSIFCFTSKGKVRNSYQVLNDAPDSLF